MEGGGRGKEVRIKDKVGIGRRETLVCRMCLRVDYPNLQQQVLIPPALKKKKEKKKNL